MPVRSDTGRGALGPNSHHQSNTQDRLTTLQASLHAADRSVARPAPGTVFLRLDTGISPDAGSAATGDPGVSPDRTHTGWLP
jgi:hypothetical protein